MVAITKDSFEPAGLLEIGTYIHHQPRHCLIPSEEEVIHLPYTLLSDKVEGFKRQTFREIDL